MGNISYSIERAKSKARKDALTFFRYCPLCYMGNAIRCKFHTFIGKDYAICSRCGAEWHIKFSQLNSFKWAKLEKESHDGKGKEYFGKELKPEFWSRLAFEGRAELEEKRRVVKEREIIREIVKVRCPFCHNLYNESYDKCPHCGGHR